MPRSNPTYRGRFAPSPTGPLHLGSLIAALASYLDARHHRGLWLVRMEDLDPPREEPGAAARILDSLRAHALHWDGELMYQGDRADAYAAALQTLIGAGHAFRCDCTRSTLGPHGACAGHCRRRQDDIEAPASWRLQVPEGYTVDFADALQGAQHSELAIAFPDFVVKRKDGLDAYQLAVVVDDCAQGVTHIVRGADLLDSTARQVCLQDLLGCPRPSYCHLPLITNRDGRKLSKQNQAPALDDYGAADNLRLALRFLGQETPPQEMCTAQAIIDFATHHWQLGRVPARLAIPAASLGLPG